MSMFIFRLEVQRSCEAGRESSKVPSMCATEGGTLGDVQVRWAISTRDTTKTAAQTGVDHRMNCHVYKRNRDS